jgi:transcriptional regulator of acetoin/glycerol metabolism
MTKEIKMVRSILVVVSEDTAFISKAQSFGHSNQSGVQVLSPDQWDHLNNNKSNQTGGVPSLLPGSGNGNETGAKVLPFPGSGSFSSSGGGERLSVSTINQLESVAIENAIMAFKGNLTEAAKALGIGRATLYRKVKAYNIDPNSSRKKRAA